MLASLRDNPPSTAEHSANTLNLSNWQNCLLIFCAAFAGLAIPTSTAAQNIGSGLLALCAIFIGPLRRQIAQAARQPFGMACLALFGWLAIATLWSGVAWSDRLEMLEKMRMYLFAPVLLAAMAQRSARQGLLFGFSLGAAISAVISIGLALTQTSWLNTQAEINNWPVFRSHTYHDLFLAWLIIGLSLAILSRKLSRGAVIAASILIVVCAADAMLLVRGRSAQVLLLAMLVWLAFRWNWRRALLPTLIAIVIAIPGLYFAVPQVRQSVSLVHTDLANLRAGQINNNSIGLRAEFYSNTLQAIAAKPLQGYGTGSFASVYAQQSGLTREKNADRATRNPHNDYLWMWIDGGIAAALLLLGVAGWGVYQAQRLPKEQRILSECVILSIASGTLINSFFTDNASGVGFVLLACALLAGPTWLALGRKPA